MSPALTFLVPNDVLLVGASFDVQGADIDGSGLITLTDNDLEIEVAAPPLANMVAIAPGTFQMGSPEPVGLAPYYNQAVSQPVHPVAITRPFWMGRFEVTQEEYHAVTGSNPSYFSGTNFPVEQVSWIDAVAYCDALTVLEAAAGRLPSGYEYRLPTEAEWEYCCRAGTTSEWSSGDSLDCMHANHYYSGVHCVYNVNGPGGAYASAVGSLSANPWGLHDMHGNVWEWCLDGYFAGTAYSTGAVSDPFVDSGSDPTALYRLFRGGSLLYQSYYCRSASRYWSLPNYTVYVIGFRVVCAPVLP